MSPAARAIEPVRASRFSAMPFVPNQLLAVPELGLLAAVTTWRRLRPKSGYCILTVVGRCGSRS